MTERMEVDGATAPDLRFDQNGQLKRQPQRPWCPESGFEPELPEEMWPHELVCTSDDGSELWVDFNRWAKLGGGGPNISYPDQKRPNVPFPWSNPDIINYMKEPNPTILVDDIVLGTMMPIPVYTPLLFLMLNGTRVGGKKIYRYPKVMSVEDVLKCYAWAQLFAQRTPSPQDPNADYTNRLLNESKTQFHATLLRVENAAKRYTEGIPELGKYLVYLQEAVNKEGLVVLGVDHGDTDILEHLSNGYISEMMLKINAHEVFLCRMLCPQMGKFGNPRRFHIGSALPVTNPRVPPSVLAELDSLLMQTALEILKLHATKFNCMFIVPKQLVLEPRVRGIPAHFLRIMAVIPLFAPPAKTTDGN